MPTLPTKNQQPTPVTAQVELPGKFPEIPQSVIDRFPEAADWQDRLDAFWSRTNQALQVAQQQAAVYANSRVVYSVDSFLIYTSVGGKIPMFALDDTGIRLGNVLVINTPDRKVYIGAGTYQSADTPFYIDTDGKFSLGANLTWDPGTATLNITGTIIATTGSIGGFNIGADYIRDTANSMGLASTVTGGDDVRFWAGDTFANRASAPFHVTESGILTATNNAVIIGSVSGRLTSTLAAAINAAGNLITDVVNPRLDSASKTILSDFNFGAVDYAGAVKSGTITWDSVTGAITGGSGIVVYRGGIVGAATGVATFTIVAATGAATFAGTLSAPNGNIGGWTIGATTLVGGNATLDSVGQMILGTVNDVVVLSAVDTVYRLWVGNAAAGSASFAVTKAGALIATGATITGSITATTGVIGGFSIGSDYIRDTANSMGLASTVTVGDDVRFWAGDTFANRATAPFNVTESGILTATNNAVIIGSVSGRLTSTLAAAINAAGNLITDVVNPRLDSGSKQILSDFNFGSTDYAGAVKSGTITWDATTGAITGGSGIVVYRGGIVGASAGVATFTILSSTGAATFAGTLSAPSGNIGGWTIGATTLVGGNATLDSIGQMILGTVNDVVVLSAVDAVYRMWVGNATAGSASFAVTKAGALIATGATITGSISASSGSIGGFTVGADYIRDAADSTGLASTVTAGDDVRFWAGAAFASRASAPFRVTESGALVATSATISGTITATVGSIGGFTIGSDYIRDAADSMGLASTVTGGDDVRFWAGATFAGRASAPFFVTEAGNLTANNATIVGTVSGRSTATIAATINSGGNVVTDLINARLDTSAKTMLSDFTFGATDYAGALKSGTITWNTTTGAITGGSGVLVYRGGIIGVAAGTATFTIDAATGAATFAGALSAPTGNIGGFVLGADYIRDLANSMGLASTVTGGDDVRFWAGDTFANRASAPFFVTEAGNITANNATIIGTVSGRSTATLAAAINSSGNLVNDLINARLDTSAKTMLAGFTFGSADYAGALMSGTITWNTTTGAITGGSGVLVYRGGIIAAASGVATITLDASTGAATFAGALSAPTGNIGGFTIGADYIRDLANSMGLASTVTGGDDVRFWAGDTFANRAAAPFFVTEAGNITANNATIVGTVSGRSTATLAGAINSSGNLVNDLINARLDTSAKTMLSGFTFGAADYSGALSSGTITWNTTTGALTGGSGVLVFRGGIIGAASGTATFTIDAATGTATFAGTLSAPSGNIGGFSIGADYIRDAANSMGLASTVTAGDDVRFWAGAAFASRSTAPFRVTEAGVLTATSGTVGGWTLGSTTITGTNTTLDSAGILTLGTSNDVVISSAADATYRLWVGNATAASASFRVTKGGALTASSATISGAITATSGSIGGFDVGSDYIRDTGNTMGLASTVTGGDDVRFWAGAAFASRATAPFRVTEAGALVSTSGAIGGFTLSSSSLTSGSGDTAIALYNSGGAGLGIRVGSTGASSKNVAIEFDAFKILEDTNLIGTLKTGGSAGSRYGLLELWDSGGSNFILLSYLGLSIPDAGVVNFGSDTNLYRAAANSLKTDDDFTSAGNIRANGVFNNNGTAGVNGTIVAAVFASATVRGGIITAIT